MGTRDDLFCDFSRKGIFTLPICPQCKDTKYVGQLSFGSHVENHLGLAVKSVKSIQQMCDRCSIKWNHNGKIEPYSTMVINGKQYVTPLKRKIQEEAERLWVEAGKPKGRSEEFWFAAEKNLL